VDVTAVVINGDQVTVTRLDAGRVDLSLIDRLARLTLEARRRGDTIHLQDPPPELRALLELCGLGDLLPEREGDSC
jgi:ABC-type transporter Mla MlaB component